MGLLDFVTGNLFGEVGEIHDSGAFPGLPSLGGEYSQFLLNRLRQDPADSDTFKLGTEAIRDATGGVAGAQRARLGDAANTGGFLDSGSVTRGLSDIDRGELEAFAGSQRDLLLALIDRQTEGILPYLSAGANEALGVSTTNAGIQQGIRSSNQGFFNSILSSFNGGSLAGLGG